MEQAESYKLKFERLQEAVKGLEDSLNIDLTRFSETEIDAIRNGQAQKFEYCTELLWKTMQAYLKDKIGEDVNGPKPVIKSFYANKLIDEKTYEQLFEMLDARNKLAHIYDQEKFLKIHDKIKNYFIVMKKIILVFQI